MERFLSRCRLGYACNSLTTRHAVTKTAEFANSVDLDEVAHNEPPHLDLLSLHSSR